MVHAARNNPCKPQREASKSSSGDGIPHFVNIGVLVGLLAACKVTRGSYKKLGLNSKTSRRGR